jgi:hypothetical protein
VTLPTSTLPRESEARVEDSDKDPPSDESAPTPAPRSRQSWPAWLIGFGSYLPLAVLGFWPVWTQWSSQLNGCNCWDQILLEWFLHWTPSAVTHGHSVLVTNYLDAPNGINVMWNTSLLALGSLASPLTQTIGVVHTMAILLTLSFALSASSMFVVLRRWTHWLPAAWLGGLAYGFSTFALEEAASGRITYVFAVIPPLLILVIDKLIRQEWSPLVGGSIIGVLAAFQLFVSEEILSITALFIGPALVVLALFFRSQVAQRARDVMRAVGAAAVTFALFSVYPLYIQLFGFDRITGPPQSHAQLALFSSDAASLVTPGTPQWIDFGWTSRISSAFSAASAGEVTFYVGIPLLVLLITCVVLLHRRVLVRIFAPIALLSFWCSMGPKLLIDNHHTGIPGIDAVLVHLPILGDIVPSRFAIVFWLAVATLFAVTLDEGYQWLQASIGRVIERQQITRASKPPSRSQRSRGRVLTTRLASVGSLVIGVGVLIPVIPAWPYVNEPADVPTFFTSQEVQQIPSGSLVATYPYALTATAWPMLWQADADMRFRILGGYAIGPGVGGAGTFFADPNPILYCLNNIYGSGAAPKWLCASGYLANSIRHLGVTTFVAGVDQKNVATAVRVMNSVLGARPRQEGGVWLWRCAPVRGSSSCRWN